MVQRIIVLSILLLAGCGDSSMPPDGDGGPVDSDTPGDSDVETGPVDPALLPTVRLISPTEGAVIEGPIDLEFEHMTPQGFGSLTLLLDGSESGRYEEPLSRLGFSAGRTPSGPHTLGVRVYDAEGRMAEDTIEVVLRHPTFWLDSVEANGPYRSGEEVVLEAEYRGEGFSLEADFSALDSNYDASRVSITVGEGGLRTIRYRISAENERADGAYAVTLRATDTSDPTLISESPVLVELRNETPMPFGIRDALFSLDPPPPSRADLDLEEGPVIAGIAGDTTITDISEATIELDIGPRAGAALRSLRIRATGYAGYHLILIEDPATTRLPVTVTLPAPVTPGSYELVFELMDETSAISEATLYPLQVRSSASGGGGNAVITGRVRYRASTVMNPTTCTAGSPRSYTRRELVGAEVRAVGGGGVVRATGHVGARGLYRLAIEPPFGEVHIEVLSRRTSRPQLEVVNESRAVYTASSVSFPVAAGPHSQDLFIPLPAPAAAAFHIFNVAQDGLVKTEIYSQRHLPPLRIRWERGNTNLSSSYGNDEIDLGGDTDDPDEWDTPVLLHELGHFVFDNLSMDGSDGGDHEGPGHFPPVLAYSEGAATFWGQLLAGHPCYWDSSSDMSTGVTTWSQTNLANLRLGAAGGDDLQPNTSPRDTDTGDLNEFLVAAVMWHLADFGSSLFPGGTYESVAWSLFTYLSSTSRMNFGASGADVRKGTDFVDFLHGWLCSSWCLQDELGTVLTSGPTGAMNDDFAFSLNFPMDNSYCPAPFNMPPTMRRRCAGDDILVLAEAGVARVRAVGDTVMRRAVARNPGGFIPTGASPRDMALVGTMDPTRAVVTNTGDGTISIVSLVRGAEREVDTDPRTVGLQRIAVGTEPRGVAVTPDGRFALVAVAGTDELVVVDLGNHRECKRIFVEREPGAGRRPVDDAEVPIVQWSVPDHVVITPDGRKGYVSLIGSLRYKGEAVAVIDVARATDCARTGGEITGYIDLGAELRPGAMAIRSAGDRLAVAGWHQDIVWVIDTATDTRVDVRPGDPIRSFFHTGQNPSDVSWSHDGRFVFSTHISGLPTSRLAVAGTVRLLSVTTGTESYDVGGRDSGRAVTSSPDDGWIYMGGSAGLITAFPRIYWDGITATFDTSVPEGHVGHRSPEDDFTGGCMNLLDRLYSEPCLPALDLGMGIREMVNLEP